MLSLFQLGLIQMKCMYRGEEPSETKWASTGTVKRNFKPLWTVMNTIKSHSVFRMGGNVSPSQRVAVKFNLAHSH